MQIDVASSPFSFAGVGAGIAFVVVYLYRSCTSPKLDCFPTVGPSGLFGAIRFLTHSLEIVQEGYEKVSDLPLTHYLPTLSVLVLFQPRHSGVISISRTKKGLDAVASTKPACSKLPI